MLVSGRITRKSVKSGPYGDKVSFLVGGNWLSAFASDKKLDQDAKDLLRSLVEGEEAEFTIVEAPNKNDPSKPYLNIVGIIKVNRLDTGEAPDYPAPPAQPTGQTGQPKDNQRESGDTRVRSMALAYAKDWGIAHKTDSQMMDREEIVRIAKRFEQYILTGE